MVAIESAQTPLEFGYIAAKHFSFEDNQIYSLREIAALYGKSGTPYGISRFRCN